MEYNRFESVEAVGVAYEMALHSGRLIWGGAIDVLIPKLFTNSKGSKHGVPGNAVISALEFAQHYYFLRDYFYFAYNVPRSVEWLFPQRDKIQINLLDDTFQLQKFLELNNWFLKSIRAFSDFKADESKIKEYVEQIQEEFVESEKLELAYEGCLREAELKLQNYQNFLLDNIVFDHYSVAQFKAVYKHILARALLRRYFVQKYEKHGVQKHGWILAPRRKQLIEALAEATSVSSSVIEKILADLTLDKLKIARGEGVTSFPLIYVPIEDFYYLFPNCVCFCDCFVSLRRAWALRDPKRYGKVVANIVGDELAKRVEHIFRTHGFVHVKRNVSLREFGERLPDVDVLSVWEELGFGHVVFLCETKNAIPEKFGKDFVRSISSKGYLTKAAKQNRDTRKALSGKNFYRLLKKNFGTALGFGTYALYFLNITSQNVGVFFWEGTTIDYESFESILDSSKGDILHVMQGLKRNRMIKACKKCSKIHYNKAKIGPHEVSFPVIEFASMLQI
jgi:hypothetical protein